MPTIGWSEFAVRRHKPQSGYSYFNIDPNEVVARIIANWDQRKPGYGENTLDRKVLVPVNPEGFFGPDKARLTLGLPVQAVVEARQQGEQPYVKVFVTPQDALLHDALMIFPAKHVDIVCYSAEALLENNGNRTTDAEWEIVAVLAGDGPEPMEPLAMARNYLELAGGTKTEYTALQFAEAIAHHALKKGVTVCAS